jgi:hypothetical protein
MKKLFTAIMLAAVVFALILPGCWNKEAEVPVGPAPGTPPMGPVAPGSHYEGGYLAGPGASYTFTVNAGSITYLEVPFTYPVGSVDFWVKVVGQDGYTVLGDFDLDNGEIIQLSGGGTFYVTVYSKMGAGNWSATY